MKIGFIIPARLKSQRLTRKTILKLKGKTVLEWVIERAKMINGIDEIVVATSWDKNDLEITEICRKSSIRYFLGSPDDVFKRIRDTAYYFGFDYVINITPDNPLFSFHIGDLIVKEIRENRKFDFLKINCEAPIGTWLYSLNMKTLDIVSRLKTITDTEVWGPLIKEEFFKVKVLDVPSFLKSDFRLTLDYPEDYQLIFQLYEMLQEKEKTPVPLYKVILFLNENPELAAINKNIKQKPVNKNLLKEIDNFLSENRKEIEQEIRNYRGDYD